MAKNRGAFYMKKSFFKRIKGATMIEYVMIVVLIAVASAAIITTLGTTIKTRFTTVNSSI